MAQPQPFSDGQLRAIAISAKVSSSISLAAVVFTLATYLLYPGFDRPINRIVFYASWGNLVAHVATMIARSGIEEGSNSALCQFQGFLINT